MTNDLRELADTIQHRFRTVQEAAAWLREQSASPAASASEAPKRAEGPTWRVGRKVARNLYRGDEPVAMLATPELAAEMAKLLNEGEKRR